MAEDIKSSKGRVLMRQVGRAEYKNGYADVYDARGVLLTRQRCDRLVGYGPEGFVVMRGNCYWAHRANGTNVPPPMTPYNFEQRKWDMHDTFLRVVC